MHRENPLSPAGAVNTTDADLLVSSRARRGVRCRTKRLDDATERQALLSSINCLGSWRWSRATDEVRASKHARSIFELDERAPLTRDMLLMAIHPEDRATVVRAIGATAHRGATGEMKIRVVGHDESGLGLGLAVCRSIILAHKGRRWAADNSDRGAAFNFTLPVTRGEGQQ